MISFNENSKLTVPISLVAKEQQEREEYSKLQQLEMQLMDSDGYIQSESYGPETNNS